MNAVATEVSVSMIAAFSVDGRVFRFSGFLLGVKPGELLLVPLGRTTGDLRGIVDCCPVPWNDVWATIDTPPQAPATIQPEAMCLDYPRLAQITPYGWVTDAIALSNNPTPNVTRLLHVSGLLFARAKP